MLVCVYTCQNTTLLEITCHGSNDLFTVECGSKPCMHSHTAHVLLNSTNAYVITDNLLDTLKRLQNVKHESNTLHHRIQVQVE